MSQTYTQIILNEVQDFVTKYEESLPTDETQIAAVALTATALMHDVYSARLETSGFPPVVLRLIKLSGQLNELMETSQRRAESQREQLRAYTRSEKLAMNGLRRSISDLESRLSATTDTHARARITTVLDIARQELKDRIELKIADRYRKFELEKQMNELTYDLQRTTEPSARQTLESEINGIKRELARA